MKCNSYHELLSIVETALTKAPAIVTAMRPANPDGQVWVYLDDYERDTRYIIEHHLQYGHCTITTIHGYDGEKHCWTEEAGRQRMEFDNKRGGKKFVERLQQLAEQETGWRNPEVFSIYVN